MELRRQIDAVRAQMRAWAHASGRVDGFDWVVEFAEVFDGPDGLGLTVSGAAAQIVNTTAGQMELAGNAAKHGGFDVILANPPYVRQELLGGEYKTQLRAIYPEVYTGTADLYVYFYARALQLARPDGMVVFISSNKFMRAGYGKALRSYMTHHSSIRAIIDFGDLPVFTASAYPVVVSLRNAVPTGTKSFIALTVDTLMEIDRLQECIDSRAWTQQQNSLGSQEWSLVTPEILRILTSIRSKGTSLGQVVGGQILAGIKTGHNAAFVINERLRQNLIEKNPESASLIRPWLRGRNVKRWTSQQSGEYLIALSSSGDMHSRHPWKGAKSEQAAEQVFAATHPGIYEHMKAHEMALRTRSDQGRYWWELRSCTYYSVFDAPKIVWPDIAKRSEFTIDFSNSFVDMTLFVIPSTDKVLLAVLNSPISEWLMMNTSSQIQNDFLRFKNIYVSSLPIPPASDSQRVEIEELVTQIMTLVELNKDVGSLEQELNARVYGLYQLNSWEIERIEESITSSRQRKALKALKALKDEG